VRGFDNEGSLFRACAADSYFFLFLSPQVAAAFLLNPKRNSSNRVCQVSRQNINKYVEGWFRAARRYRLSFDHRMSNEHLCLISFNCHPVLAPQFFRDLTFRKFSMTRDQYDRSSSAGSLVVQVDHANIPLKKVEQPSKPRA
jgi:hypothetical protein